MVTGGAGYIGSHICIDLLTVGYPVTVVDNLSNSKQEALHRISEITGHRLDFVRADVRDRAALDTLFRKRDFDAVIHCAGLKAVGESTQIPLEYYANNIGGTLTLCRTMAEAGVKKIVFSSSATVYGDPAKVPIREDFPTCATNPYGHSKLFIEEILRDLYRSDDAWSVVLLRYFNPVGAHPSGRIGEDPNGIPNNLMPFIVQVAVGRQPRLRVFGNDYVTPDGTGVRDYIHVADLAGGHRKALERLTLGTGVVTYNLGTGHGYSVLEVVRAFEQASGRSIPYTVVARRPGDIAICYADPALAKTELDWSTDYGIQEMVRDAWCWQSQTPQGYQ